MRQNYDYEEALLGVTDEDDALSATQSTKYRLPNSCCIPFSGYENNTCIKYYESGCTSHMLDFVSETILIVASILLATAVLQVRS